MRQARRHANLVLAIVLVLAAAGLIVLGMQGLGAGAPTPPLPSATLPPTATESVLPPPSSTPPPTATEPILPPPPTSAPTRAGVVDVASATPRPFTQTVAPTEPQPVGPASSSTAAAPTPTLAPTGGPAPTPVASPSPAPASPSPPETAPPGGLYTLRQRLGIGGGGVPMTQDLARRLGLGWYLDWAAYPDRFRSAEVDYVPMIRLRDGGYYPAGEALLAAIDGLPGALWLIGNEPDVRWQDNVPPDVYARLYHELYHLLKARDPACRVAIGGVSQPTPLRLRYLDRILAAYQAEYGEPMPVDVWNVHNFILREERDSWGVDIPPGLEEDAGTLREIADHDDLAIFRQQLVDFRRWMKQRGQQNKPLIVSEYGILMPNDYGFPPEKVRDFMLDTFRIFETAVDPALGYPADGYRLVQRWCWFSLADARYPTGNLAVAESGALTLLGEAFAAYATPVP